MGTPLLLLLLVMAKLYNCHVIYTKESPRIRVAYEEWKPVRDSPLRHIRHPVYHKSNGYSYIPGKKGIHQSAEQSEKVEVFSPAPPTILGSFSVFGHATVNAREPASQMNKKLPRPHLSELAGVETRPKVSSYQIRHQYPHIYSGYHHSDIKRPQYAANEQSYFYEGSLRPPPHEQSKAYPHAALSPASYYGYEQGQLAGHVFHDEKYYKPQKVYNSYRHPAPTYATQHNDYRTTSPSNYDSTYSYYNSPSQIDTEYYNQNPVGAIPLNIKTDSKLKPVTENNVHDHLPHYGRPFQNTQSFTTVDKLNDDVDTYATTLPASPTVETKVKFSDVAQPFRVSTYENVAVSSSKPENNQAVYTEDVYPISVTTIDVPTVVETQNIKSDYDDYDMKYHKPFKPSPYDHSNHKLTTSSYKNYNENNPPAFLPTPSTDVSPYLTEPKSEITTISPLLNNYQESDSLSSVENKAEEDSESYTEIYSTVPIETTTKTIPTRARRPTRPSFSSTSTTNYNNQYWDSYYKHQRRRKPSNKVRSRDSLEKNNYSKQRSTTTTTTTTTPPPENEETDVFDYTTILPESNSPINREQYGYTGDKIEPTIAKESVNEKYITKNIDSDERKTKVEDITTTSSSTTTVAPTTSTTQLTTVPAVSVEPGNRLKNKYGNRPRFSIKDYREKLNRASTTASPQDNEKAKPIRNETEFKFRRTKSPTIARTTTESSESIQTSSEHKFQKYKPRGSSWYKTTSTTTPKDTDITTTERSNTFKPSTNRYKPGTGKYYSRYRTSTTSPKEVDDSPSTTTKVTIRPKGVFSAKRQPFPLKSKPTTPKSEDEEEEMPVFSDSLKTNENEVYSAVITKKMDDATTTTISSGDEKETYDKDEGVPTGLESSRVADLTSSSTNDFHQSSHYKNDKPASKRPLPKITLPTDNPILPLEAFFQTQQ